MLLRGVYTQAQEPHNGTSGEYTTEFPSLPPPRRHLSFDDTQRSTPVMRDGEVGAARSGPRLNSSCPSSGSRGRGRGRFLSASAAPPMSASQVSGEVSSEPVVAVCPSAVSAVAVYRTIVTPELPPTPPPSPTPAQR
ncbi:hypothetical protein V1264_022202 [Littorina saxatilis]|uniref:Uncharacterized protein n=1 Tax=Littorina saxatilis TaxID=31220 RepID=A0AAN9AK11_9CAEN